MTWRDPIVEEVRRARDAYAARFNHDLRAIFRDLQEQEKRGGREIEFHDSVAVSEPSQAAPVAETSNVSEVALVADL